MQYFKHMTNMRHNLQIKRLIQKYGIEGYGLYNLIIESIVEKLSNDSPYPELQESCDDLAEFYNGNTSRLNEIAAFMINQGLLEVDEISMKITCRKIYKYLEQNQTRSKKIRKLISNYKKSAGLDGVSDMQETVSDMPETEVIEEEKKKKRIRKELCSENPPNLNDVIKYVQEKNITNVDPNYFYEYFTSGNWVDSKGNQVYNWKQKILTWARHSENKPATKPTALSMPEMPYIYDVRKKQ